MARVANRRKRQLDVEGCVREKSKLVEETEPDHDEEDGGDVALVREVNKVMIDQIVDHDNHACDVLNDIRDVVDVLYVALESMLAHLLYLYVNLVRPRV